RYAGRPFIEWIPILSTYLLRAASGQTSYIRPLTTAPTLAGTLSLPGDAARLRLITDAAGIAYVHDPHTRHLTAILRVRHGGTILLDPDKQAELDAGWARVMDSIARFDS